MKRQVFGALGASCRNKALNMAIWRGLKSFGARDFSPENSSDEGLKSLAPTKTAALFVVLRKNLKNSNINYLLVRFIHVQAQPPVHRKMKKNMVKMFLMSGVVVVAFSSCDHLSLSLSHYGGSMGCQAVVVPASRPVVVHRESAAQHVVVHHGSAPKHVVVHHESAAKPHPFVRL
ncbi:MAG: hypothetical protein IKW48_05980 [Akkermansia sp.]|nr:hypothetical protein [Akkermansia sp.]